MASVACLSADRVVRLGLDGPAPFLDADRLVRTAVEQACDALHPGIGFLSESPLLSHLCQQRGVTFVGPSSAALALCGDKNAARTLAKQAGLPILPGAMVESAEAAAAVFSEIASAPGGAVLKALAGGGGKGIRHVVDAGKCSDLFHRAESEAQRAFGDGRLLLERFVPRARHVEVQLVVDQDGQVSHLGDRDCSIQRRYQKLLEIAPAPHLAAATRSELHEMALVFGRSLVPKGLCGLATVEFLLDLEDGSYFFMECNPRLQVEATITEEISGLDLVATQLHLARGASLSVVAPASSSSASLSS